MQGSVDDQRTSHSEWFGFRKRLVSCAMQLVVL